MALILVLSVLLGSCSSLHKIEYDRENNVYTDTKTGIVYTDAPGCYEPVQIGDEYARWKVNKDASIVLHVIGDMDPAKWLCEEGKTVFYAEGVTLPTLREMAPETLYICVEATLTMALATLTDAEVIERAITLWESAESIPYSGKEPTQNLRIKFASNAYPGLYYSLIYLEYSDGSRVLYDRSSGRCVEAGDLFEAYVGGGTAET